MKMTDRLNLYIKHRVSHVGRHHTAEYLCRVTARIGAWFLAAGLTAALALASAEPAYAAEGFDQVGTATMKDIGTDAMVPIDGSQIPDGTYTIKVRTSSTFFKIESAELTVENGEMTALLYMYTSSYSHVYMGTAEEAAAASEDDYIPSEEIDYYDTFTIPVEALDKPIDCAAFSKKKQKWYARKLVFLASSLPEGTLSFELPDYDLINDALAEYEENHPEEFSDDSASGDGTDADGTAGTSGTSTGDAASSSAGNADGSSSAGNAAGEDEALSLDMADGEYSIEVSLAGGSGRASVTSPTWFYIRDGKAYAKLLWSSSYYDYMIVDGVRYENETTDGSNSTFTIPVEIMDSPITIVADTTAMGDPVEIEYTLTFYEATIGSKSNVPQEGAKKVIIIAFIIMIGGGLLNWQIKRRHEAQ